MISTILSFLAGIVIGVIRSIGYGGIFLLMLLGNANIPVPSEIIMPFSGFLVSEGVFSLWFIIIAGTLGSVVGSYLSYSLAGGIVRLRTHSKFLHLFLSDSSLESAQRWFSRFGGIAVFVGCFVPVVRSFMAFPAGLAKMPLKKFLPLVLAGSFLWTSFLAYIGWTLGVHWESIGIYFRRFDYVILAILILAIAGWLLGHLGFMGHKKIKKV